MSRKKKKRRLRELERRRAEVRAMVANARQGIRVVSLVMRCAELEAEIGYLLRIRYAQERMIERMRSERDKARAESQTLKTAIREADSRFR